MTIMTEPQPWLAVATARTLKKKSPLQVTYYGKPVVLFRDDKKIHALADQCPHRGLPLSQGCVKSGQIQCRYHGWQFNGEGALTDIPGANDFSASNAALISSYAAIEESGLIWLKNDQQQGERFVPSFHQAYGHTAISLNVKADILEVLENFLDALHTHTIHPGLIRSNNKKRHPCQVTVTNLENGYQAEYIEEQKQSGLISNLFGRHIIKSIGRVRYPGIAEVEYQSAKGVELSVVIYARQQSAGQCKLIIRTYLRKGVLPFFLKMSLLAPLQLLALIQDKRILEQQYIANQKDSTFRPCVTDYDVMRPYIEKALKGEIDEVFIQKTLML